MALKRKLQLAGIVILVGLIAIQFVHPARNQSATAGPNAIATNHPVPANVAQILQRACYDCHSNNTHYPWYAAVQPVGWWLNSHVNDGKRHLNFSEFSAYPAKRAKTKAGEIVDEVELRHMPLKAYTWLHPEARLTPAEIALVVDWAENLQEAIVVP